jgi:hypothetical protein
MSLCPNEEEDSGGGFHGVPPAVQWERISSVEDITRLICEFENFCAGRGHPQLGEGVAVLVDESRSYLQNAQKLTAWCLRLSGIAPGQEEKKLFCEQQAQCACMDRFFYFWDLYRNFHIMQVQLADSDPHGDETRELLRKLSFCYEVCVRIERAQSSLFDLYRFHLNTADYGVPDALAKSSTHQSLLRLWGQIEETRKRSDYEELLIYLLDCAATHRYRKLGSTVYREKHIYYAGCKYGTRYWEPVSFNPSRADGDSSTVEAFMQRFCRKENKYEMWSRLVNLKGQAEKLRDYLTKCDDLEFPFLLVSRNILSFQNGIYNTRLGVGGAFYPYHLVARHLKSDVVAAKYFDMELDEGWLETSVVSWWDIPTPLFQSILDYQNWGVPDAATAASSSTEDGGVEDDETVASSAAEARRVLYEAEEAVERVLYDLKWAPIEDHPRIRRELAEIYRHCLREAEKDPPKGRRREEVAGDGTGDETTPPPPRHAGAGLPMDAQRWVYIFLGRMLHYLGDFDTWQIIPFFKGRGGSGKSTVAHVAKSFFSPSDVGILSNNSEKKFGLQALVNKLVFICFELKKNISLEQAEFQSMVSGEEVCVAIKNQEARVLRWRLPGLLCGNEAPGWIDAQGSIARRLAIFGFKYTISDKHSDPDLLNRILTNELAALVVKCNVAYRNTAWRHQGEDIWYFLPAYFREERRSLQRDTDPLSNAIWDQMYYELACRDKTKDKSQEYLDTEFFIPFEDFEVDYKRRSRDLRGTQYADPLVPDKYGSAFSEAGLEVFVGEKVYKDVARNEKWILGMRQRVWAQPRPPASF